VKNLKNLYHVSFTWI